MRQPVEYNYAKKLMELLAAGKVPFAPGGATPVEVRHDDWCGVFKGQTCNCNPDIVFWPPTRGQVQ